MIDELEEIQKACDVRFRLQLLRHQKVLKAMDDLDKELSLLDDLRSFAHTNVTEISSEQKVGSDVMWQGWLLRRRMELQRQMSLMKAHEAESFEMTRSEFNRNHAVSILLEEEFQKRRDALKQRNQLSLEELSSLKLAE